jgi:coiled-coil domain-containing protein 12
VIKNRNFDPESRTLKKRTREDDAAMQDTVEKDVEGLAQMIIKEDEQRRAQELVGGIQEIFVHLFSLLSLSQDVFNIAPKRPNWDLKRELDKKLAKLERKTQESIHTLIRLSPFQSFFCFILTNFIWKVNDWRHSKGMQTI